MNLPIYLDSHATTPVDPQVAEAMLPYFGKIFGNASSRNHSFGWEAEEAVALARKQVASLIGASPREIVFTSGATESNNLAIKGVVEFCRHSTPHVITCTTEHKAVLDCTKRLEQIGCSVSYLPVNREGLLDPKKIRSAIKPQTTLISVMAANNEIGVIQPIKEIGQIACAQGIPLHVDAAQAAGKISIDVEHTNIDLLSLTAHKMYGPKGVGALYVRRQGNHVGLTAQISGGGHERGMRSGTLNVPGIVGFGKACELCADTMESEAMRVGQLRDMLWEGLCEQLDGLSINGSRRHRLPQNLNASIAGVDGEALLLGVDDIAVSSGSACTTETPEPSHVLRSLGVKPSLAHASLRFGLGRFTTADEIRYTVMKVAQVVRRLRQVGSAS